MNWDRTTPSLVALPAIRDERGALGFVQPESTCPFAIRRIYYMYDLTPGVERGSHAHHRCLRQLIAMSGVIAVRLETAAGVTSCLLDSPAISLLVPALAWITFEAKSDNAVLLALASEEYDEADYIRSRAEFLSLISR